MIEMASKWPIVTSSVQALGFERIVEEARRLSFSEKIKLVRILVQEIETYADEHAPIEPSDPLAITEH